ncbi:hypothetical protein V1512DRAFT_292909 [Lipomyces arxii]|uniref:uncharacterized protein n=1 Tax=Lipomyces arxii TaxID=56418 RepID=UPI0034CDC8CB
MEGKFALEGRSKTLRRRKITICQSCSLRRVRCDRVRPKCHACAVYGSECVYAENDDMHVRKLKRTRASAFSVSDGDVGLISADSTNQRFRYANSAHWAMLFREEDVDREIVGESILKVQNEETNDLTDQIKNLAGRYLPSKEDCASHITRFFRYFNSFFFLLSSKESPEMLNGLVERLHRPDYKFDKDNDHYVPVLFAVLYGSINMINQTEKFLAARSHLNGKKPDLDSVIEQYGIAIELALQLFSYPSQPSMSSLLAAVLFQVFRQSSSGVIIAGSVAYLCRIAQSMGLHRDPSLFKQLNFTVEEAELRRRLWWFLVSMDTAVSINSGLPATLTPKSYDIRLPSESVATEYGGLPIIFTNGVYRTCRMLCITLSDLYGVEELSSERLDNVRYMLADSQKDMEERIHRIENIKIMVDQDGDNFRHAHQIQKLACLVLGIAREKYRLIMHYALESQYKKRSNGGPSVKKAIKNSWMREAVKSAVILLQKYAEIFLREEYAGFYWHARQHHQFHSIVIVLRDIYDSPEKPSYLEQIPAVDDRIGAVESAINVTVLMRLDKYTPFASKQWANLMRFKDAAFERKFPGHSDQPAPAPASTTTSLSIEQIKLDESPFLSFGSSDTTLEQFLNYFDDVDVDWSPYKINS